MQERKERETACVNIPICVQNLRENPEETTGWLPLNVHSGAAVELDTFQLCGDEVFAYSEHPGFLLAPSSPSHENCLPHGAPKEDASVK